MKHIGAAIGEVAAEIAAKREFVRAERDRLIREGHERHGWALDAECANCGDTGKWPNSIHYCGCPHGEARRTSDRNDREVAEWERRWGLTGVPKRFRDYRVSGCTDTAAVAAVTAWLSGRRWESGDNLLLTGPVGTGKTALAIGALREIHDTGHGSLRFAPVPATLDQLRPDGTDEDPGLMRSLLTAGVLILDDLGAEKSSPWVLERLYVLVNARYEEMRSTIVTTNLDIPGLVKALGERTVSRLIESVTVVVLDGPDRRRG